MSPCALGRQDLPGTLIGAGAENWGMTNRELFEILLRENAGMLWSYLRSLVNATDADDLFQQTCLEAWRSLDRYDKARPIGPWLRGIASNLVFVHWRKSKASVTLDAQTL